MTNENNNSNINNNEPTVEPIDDLLLCCVARPAAAVAAVAAGASAAAVAAAVAAVAVAAAAAAELFVFLGFVFFVFFVSPYRGATRGAVLNDSLSVFKVCGLTAGLSAGLIAGLIAGQTITNIEHKQTCKENKERQQGMFLCFPCCRSLYSLQVCLYSDRRHLSDISYVLLAPLVLLQLPHIP